jgi:drug/metabolite transporter (DMT)-like permease
VLSVVLAAFSAVIWGAGDFCGGKATQRASALRVTVVAQLAGLPVVVLGLALIPATSPRPSDIGWGALAGVAGFVGIVLLYRGLAAGAMAIFAPVTAVTAALVPLGAGLVLDDPPGTLALIGVCCAIIAIGLMSVQVAASGRQAAVVTPRLLLLALAAGTMFGLFFTVLGRAGDDAGMWPVLGVRVGSITLGLLLVARQRVSLRLDRPVLRLTATAGVFDITANALYLLAAQRGLLSVVAPIAALYPASTVLLALLVDRERLRPIQVAGLGLAATSLVLVAS